MNRMERVAVVLVAAAIGLFLVTVLLAGGSEPTTAHVPDLDQLYNPAQEGEDLPTGFRQVLARDAIPPIYDPRFVSGSESGWDDEALVVGLEIDGDARAYPVSHLNRREIVNDHVGKTPVLVTW